MNFDSITAPKNHQGRNVRRLREMRDITQDEIAEKLNMSQQSFSKLEAKDIIDDNMLDKIAMVLNVSKETIKNMNEETAISIISNSFHDTSILNANYYPTFNPLDKLMELVDENRKLYERLLEAEKERNKK